MEIYKKVSLTVFVVFLTGLPFAADSQGAESGAMNIPAEPMTQRPAENAASIAAGLDIYNKACIYCHGTEGAGDGPVAYFLSRDTGPHPRDFTSGLYKFRSTPTGYLPADEDILRTITTGVPGYMPSFAGLNMVERWQLVYYVKSLYPDFQDDETEYLEIVGSPIPQSAASTQRGYEVYQQFKCWECHGGAGKGDGEKAAELRDDWDFSLPPSNLTMPSSFKNGRDPVDLYRTFMGGLDGGAMPAYADFFAGEEENAWHLINYINSLSAE